MLDIKFIRDHPEEVQKNTEFRGGKISVSQVLAVDKTRRELILKIENLRAQRNQQSSGEVTGSQKAQAKELKEKLKGLEKELQDTEKLFLDKLCRIPNMSSSDMREGGGAPDHVELAVWIPGRDFLP